ncbi:hypothetical protein G4B88_028604 [Cannabis sativa]|uniref:Agglutinin domain-containing protein n=1 Tax=Cannabis sativa TaxID=3483 RepID=A0A7J6F1V1_CANSA|nr:hypothetical protein G4B88_028604 [Cannabis sativa]
MPALLPRFVVLKHTNSGRYVRILSKEESDRVGVIDGFLKCDGTDITSPFVKFELEIAKSDSNFVHIRSSYNNKYFLIVDTEPSNNVENRLRVVATADQPEEDTSSSSCTMFKLDNRFGGKNFIFMSPRQRSFEPDTWAGEPYANGLVGRHIGIGGYGVKNFLVVDWDSLVIFPKEVSFKLAEDEKYLALRQIQRHPYLQFVDKDNGDDTTEFEISTVDDGYVRIKSLSNKKFWRRSPNWIWADSDEQNNLTGLQNNIDTLFWPVKTGNSTVALRNLGNYRICKALTADRKTDCLNAVAPNITDDARMEVRETRVISREIRNITYRLKDSRIYDDKVIDLASSATSHNNTDRETTLSSSFTHTSSRSSTFSNNFSFSLGARVTYKIGLPAVSQWEVEMSTEFVYGYTWGETETKEESIQNIHTITVPPWTRSTVSLITNQAKCDVPFSYVQHDVLSNGHTRTETMHDGMYTGINMFNLVFNIVEEKIEKPTTTPLLSLPEVGQDDDN